MPRKPTMRFPSVFPRWATANEATLEPSEQIKDDGWNPNTFFPARFMNWINNITYEWIRRIGSLALSNVKMSTPFTFSGGTDIFAAGYFPVGILYLVDDEGLIYFSDTDYYWSDTPAQDLTEPVLDISNIHLPAPIAYTDNRLLFGTVSGKLWTYTDSTETWNFEASATVGGTGPITALDTGYRSDSTVTILARDNINTNGVRINIGDYSMDWYTSSTPPIGVIKAYKVLHVYASTWFILGYDYLGNVTLHKSIDDGDTWEAVPVDWSLVNFRAIDIEYNSDSGTLVMSGSLKNDDKEYAFMWSTDQGDNWEFSTTVQHEVEVPPLYSVSSKLLHCGGPFWVATKTGDNMYPSYFLSCNDGLNFEQVNIDSTPIERGVLALACDTQKVHFIGHYGFHAVSQAVVLED